MITVSVVIVNYNVKYFLARCLESVLASVSEHSIEVIVVDNASTDKSQEYILSRFDKLVTYIYNNKNIGFSKANNIGFSKVKGEYILILNPDTIIGEDTIENCVNYLIDNPHIGALGPRMIAGGGQFLKESKRGLPSPWNAFCKFSGLSTIFPRTRLFNKYNLGYIAENEVSEVEVLCGACIVTRKSVIDKIGGFDESYFMYGEDIDLSNKVNRSGYKTVYYPLSTIIHFKGESSKRASFSYTKHFYIAMLIYIDKNKKGIDGFGSKLIVKFSILLLGIINFTKQNIIEKGPMVVDGIILYFSFDFIRKWWGQAIFDNPNYFNNNASTYNSIGAVMIWILSIWVFGHYDTNWKINRLKWGIIVGTIAILVIYSLLPANLRSSRAMILLGTIPLGGITYGTYSMRNLIREVFTKKYKSKYIFLGSQNHVSSIEKQLGHKIEIADEELEHSKINNSEHIVIDSMQYSNKQIIKLVDTTLKNKKILISGGENSYLLHSEKSNSQGQTVNLYSNAKLNVGYYQRIKRMFDILFTVSLMIKYPFQKNRSRIKLSEMYGIFVGQKTWVGYSTINMGNLPRIKEGVFNTQGLIKNKLVFPEIQDGEIADIYYAINYSIMLDYKIVMQKLNNHGAE